LKSMKKLPKAVEVKITSKVSPASTG
jgi:hypothetical protein